MNEWVKLKAADKFELSAYVARPQDSPIGGLVVLQEAFGVNAHIRSVADGFAHDGFLVVAPALFDRQQKNVELGYEGEDLKSGIAMAMKIDIKKALADIAAALEYAHAESHKKVQVIGYCLGGLLAWLTASHHEVESAVGYYAGRIGNYADVNICAPVMLHFGRLDTHIPEPEVAKVQAAHPDVELYWYEAGHAFNNDLRPSYQPEAARLARSRSLDFLKRHLK
jgi:carboxymethylenebutenolidase